MTNMRELTDTELDEVCGGTFNFASPVIQTNTALQVGVALGLGGPAAIQQLLGQSNFSIS